MQAIILFYLQAVLIVTISLTKAIPDALRDCDIRRNNISETHWVDDVSYYWVLFPKIIVYVPSVLLVLEGVVIVLHILNPRCINNLYRITFVMVITKFIANTLLTENLQLAS